MNGILYDRSLDFQCKGFLCFLLSKEDDWAIRVEELAQEVKEGRTTIYRLLEKLKEAGYVSHYQEDFQLPDGTWKRLSQYMVFEDKNERREVPYFPARFESYKQDERRYQREQDRVPESGLG